MDQYLTAFLIGFSLMMTAHYGLEETWGANEKRSSSLRMLFNYAVGTLGICISFLYLHPELWFDMLVSVSGAGSATLMAHRIDHTRTMRKRDRADGLIEETKDQA